MKKYIVILTLLFIILLFLSPLELRFKIISTLFILFVSGLLLSKYYDGGMGFVLLKGKLHKQLNINKIPPVFFSLFADLSFFIGFGILSLFFRKIKLKNLVLGFFVSFIMYLLIVPQTISTILHQTVELDYIKGAIISFFGFSTATLFSLLLSTLSIIYNIFSNQAASPGATLLLPGLNLPFFEGVLAIALLAIFHEAGHAIFAMYHKIKIKSSGIVFFGIIPIGAFVEPDDQVLISKPKKIQNDVFIAGSGINFLLSFLSSLLLFSFLLLFSSQSVSGLVLTGNYSGTILYSLNNQTPINFTAQANSKVYAETNKGIIVFESNKEGKIGISGYIANKENPYFQDPILMFIFNFLSLSTTLNFIIASTNLLPIYFLDGQRIFSISLPKSIANPLIVITTVSLLINFLPWFF